MSISLHSKLKDETCYKLIQITPGLLETLKDDKRRSQLKFKSLDDKKSDVVLCSDSETWIVRQKNHSNTVLLMHEFVPEEMPDLDKMPLFGAPAPVNDFLGFSRTNYEYETKPTKGLVNVDLVPIYNGELEFPKNPSKVKIKTEEELLNNSSCSINEFRKRWAVLGGCTVNGYVCILSSDFLSKALHVTLMSIMDESLDLEKLIINNVYSAVIKDTEEEFNPYSKDVVKTVLLRYGIMNIEDYENSDHNNEMTASWRLNMKEIAQWYGIMALKKYVSKTTMPQDEFLINWKSLFPPFFPCDIDIDLLRGWFFKPTGSSIQYISKDTLPMEPKDRFKMLFKLQSQWELEDIVPFIEELNVKNLKVDSFIMKFARRRKIGGNKIVVTSR